MPWWVWAVVLWVVLGTLVALTVGTVVRAADRRERKGQVPVRDEDEQAPPEGRQAS